MVWWRVVFVQREVVFVQREVVFVQREVVFKEWPPTFNPVGTK